MNKRNSQIPSESSPEIIELTIDSLSYNGGRGVGRHQGIVVFVPGTAPQDWARVRITLKKKRFWEGEVVEILRHSPLRRKPPCPVAMKCGGCSWQHVKYATQVEQKEQILAISLRGLSKLGEFKILPLLGAKEEFHYRNRIQVQYENGKFGFFEKRTNNIVETDECWIAEPALNVRLKLLAPEMLGKARRIELAQTEDGEVQAIVGDRDPESALFSQVNSAQNEVLKERVLALVKDKPEWIMDLYAGSGNLTFPLAEKFPEVPIEAVEMSRGNVERARRKEIGNVHWHANDVAKALTKWKPLQDTGLIVLDPPRPGCDPKVIDQLLRHRPKQIIYVSCDPTTFARDAEILLKSGAYKLESVQGLDMFPQTEHVELIASLCAAT